MQLSNILQCIHQVNLHSELTKMNLYQGNMLSRIARNASLSASSSSIIHGKEGTKWTMERLSTITSAKCKQPNGPSMEIEQWYISMTKYYNVIKNKILESFFFFLTIVISVSLQGLCPVCVWLYYYILNIVLKSIQFLKHMFPFYVYPKQWFHGMPSMWWLYFSVHVNINR